MSVIEKINVGGTAYNIADSQNIAPVEESNTSANAYAVGDLLIYQGQLYKVTSAIAVGNTLTVGANISATKISAMFNNSYKTLYTNTSGKESGSFQLSEDSNNYDMLLVFVNFSTGTSATTASVVLNAPSGRGFALSTTDNSTTSGSEHITTNTLAVSSSDGINYTITRNNTLGIYASSAISIDPAHHKIFKIVGVKF